MKGCGGGFDEARRWSRAQRQEGAQGQEQKRRGESGCCCAMVAKQGCKEREKKCLSG